MSDPLTEVVAYHMFPDDWAVVEDNSYESFTQAQIDYTLKHSRAVAARFIERAGLRLEVSGSQVRVVSGPLGPPPDTKEKR